MRIGIIGPTEGEINPFIEELAHVKVEKHALLTFHAAPYENIEVVCVCSGICKVNAAMATQLLIDKYNVTHVIVIGVAGAIDENLHICDTIIPTEVSYHDVDENFLRDYHPNITSKDFNVNHGLLEKFKVLKDKEQYKDNMFFGKIVTGEAFIDQDGRDEIIQIHSPSCVDMETGAIAHVCAANDIPFIAIRSMSDTVNQSGEGSFIANYKVSTQKSIDVLKDFLGSL